MTDRPIRRTQLHALAAATALALASMAGTAAIAAERINLGGLESSATHDRFIVKYRDGSSERTSAAARDAALQAAVGAVPASRSRGALVLRHVRSMAVGADVVRTSRKLDQAEAESLMRQIAANPNVEYVEVDKLNKPVFTPNDPNFGQQFGFGTGAGGIRATEAWDITSGSGAVVAVLDTGITNHSDLNANILPGYDFIIDTAVAADGNGRDSDPSDPGDASGGYASSWHGTHVTGTVAAVTNNGKGVAGTAFGAKVVPVRVLGKGGGYDSDIADAVIWASGGSVSGVPANANPAEAINLSLGGTGSCGSAMQSAINGAVGRGSTLVIAAGNSNANTSGFSPANCANVIAVGSVTSTGARSSFSNYGAVVDIAAPGSSIMSTLNSGSNGPGSESYASYSGTSMAAPHVAGVVALIQSVSNPAKTPAQVEALIKSTARAFPSTPSQPIGAGIVNAKAAVDAAGGGGGGTNTPPTANFTVSTSGLTATFTNTSTDSDGTIASRSWNFGDGTTSTAASPSRTYASAGTYTVTLTVTDDDGASSTKSSQVTVSAGGGGGSVLTNGVPVTGLSASAGNSLYYTINVPAGATNLVFTSSGGSGDADMYVRFGSQPTDSTYTCRPYLSGNNETCSIPAPSAGTYHVRLKAYQAFSGVSLVASYGAGGGGGSQTYSNNGDYAINDRATVESPITVSGRTGNAPASTPVAVNIVHTYRGDLKVDLVAPDGSVYVLHNRSGGSADNIIGTYNVNLSSEPRNGTWRLRVNDGYNGDTGYINAWSITF
jgi:serine protease